MQRRPLSLCTRYRVVTFLFRSTNSYTLLVEMHDESYLH